MDDHKKILAREWFDAGVSDYQYAEVGLKEKQVFPQIAFLAQQFAEKFIKGFLVLHGSEPPRIHDLPKLLDECVKIDANLEELRGSCELLTGFYVESRYPPDIPQYTKEEILEAFDKACQVKEKIEKVAQSLLEEVK